MGQRLVLSEEDYKDIRGLYRINEQQEQAREEKMFCNKGNTKSIHDILGSDEFEDYIEGIKLRKNGVHGLVDKLEVLKTMRLFPQITDGGVDLAHQVATTLQEFKPYNYFDETNKQCHKVMDKIIELYKENEHGEELVKDIEKVLAHQDPTPRTKEYLKRCMNLIKEK